MATAKATLHKAVNVLSMTQDHHEVRLMGLEHITSAEWEWSCNCPSVEERVQDLSLLVTALNCPLSTLLCLGLCFFSQCYFCLYQVWGYGHMSGMYSVCERPVQTFLLLGRTMQVITYSKSSMQVP